MKVMVLSHLFSYEIYPQYGSFVTQQVEAIQKLGLEPVVVSPLIYLPKFIKTKNKRWQHFQKTEKFINQEGLHIYYPRAIAIPKKLIFSRGFLFYIFLKNFFDKLFKKYDFEIIHAHTVLPDSHLGIYLKKRYQVPIITTIHGADVQILMDISRTHKHKIYQILQHIDHIVVVSKKLKQELVEETPRKIGLPPTTVIYNGIKTYDRYEEIELNNSNTKFNLITIGNITRNKNHLAVLKALQIIGRKDIKYHIIGSGWFENNLKKSIKHNELSDLVQFWGAKDHQEAMALLKAMDIFILPSIRESFGLVYIEAMYFGKITIGSKNQGIAEVIENNSNGFLVDPMDESEIADVLRYVFDNFNSLNELRINAQKTVKSKFTWENNAIQYFSLYKNILN
ncbi:MAG: glycosyltransferase [Caldithrix sp.]|nr:glycosyltransferase [Caldithrix sp.]